MGSAVMSLLPSSAEERLPDEADVLSAEGESGAVVAPPGTVVWMKQHLWETVETLVCCKETRTIEAKRTCGRKGTSHEAKTSCTPPT